MKYLGLIAMRIYNNLKPLFVFILSIVILSFLGEFNFIENFVDFVSNTVLKPSRDFIIDTMLSLLILIMSIVLYLIETIIYRKFSKLEVQILNENKQNGDTPLYIKSGDGYKVGFIRIKLDRKVRSFPSGDSNLKIIFPKGINVDWEDYLYLFEEKENELTIDLKEISLTDESILTIPFQYVISSKQIEQKQNIEIVCNIKWCFKKYIERKIEIKGDK